MRVNHNNANHILPDGFSVETMECFCYLGCTITTDGGSDADCRLNKARAAFVNLQALETAIFNGCVKSVLLYGGKTWLVSNSITQRL